MGVASNKRRGKSRETVAKAVGDFADSLCSRSSNSAGKRRGTISGNTSSRTFSWDGGSRVCPGDCEGIQRIMKQWVGNAHGEWGVRYPSEKREGLFDFRGGWNDQLVPGFEPGQFSMQNPGQNSLQINSPRYCGLAKANYATSNRLDDRNTIPQRSLGSSGSATRSRSVYIPVMPG